MFLACLHGTLVEVHIADFMPKVPQYLDVPLHLGPKHANIASVSKLLQLPYGVLSSFFIQSFNA